MSNEPGTKLKMDERIPVIRCKDCEFYDEDVWYKGIIMAHHGCRKWADGCATDPNGYCFLGKRKEHNNE